MSGAEIKLTPLGAGQDVGRSCILLSMGGKNIMLDCGMHMGFTDERRFPDFSFICDGPITAHIDCVIISHFHLDHCGALPYMSEMVGYNGPIYMTHPTKAICPIMLEDYRKVSVDRLGVKDFFTSEQIKACMAKVQIARLYETIKVDDELEIKAYYAGHVLGAAMFQVRVGQQSIVYTGDFNMTPDRHLGAARIDRCQPDLLITESTYATTIRDSKRCRERDFLKKVQECIDRKGKLLIPVFALGRAQELCILLEQYWERMNLTAPIYFTQGLAEAATQYYKLFVDWTNENIKRTFVHRNIFDFKYIQPFDKTLMDAPGPMVVFATPGMLHAGTSLMIFKKWCNDANNMLIMPGYCVRNTVGWKILNGTKKFDHGGVSYDVKLSVQYMSFSAHADAKGILQLISHCQPGKVMLVHGEKAKMEFLAGKIKQQMGVSCLMPANGETVSLTPRPRIPATADSKLLNGTKLMHCLLLTEPDGRITAVEPNKGLAQLGLSQHEVRFTCRISSSTIPSVLQDRLMKELCLKYSDTTNSDGTISVQQDAVHIQIQDSGEDGCELLVSWSLLDDDVGTSTYRLTRDLALR